MAFRGQSDHSLDSKKRLTVPSKYRSAFADGVVLHKWLDPCVALWTPDGFEAFTKSWLPDLNPLGRTRRHLSGYLVSNSWDVDLDSAGRVTLNQQLLAHAGIEKDVVVVGNVDHLEVWDRERWLKHQEELASEVAELAESIGNPS